MIGGLAVASLLAGIGLGGLTLAGELGAVLPRLDIINQFRPLIAGAALALLLGSCFVWCRSGGRPAMLLALCVLAIQGRFVIPEHVAGAGAGPVEAGQPSGTLTIVTFNMLQQAAAPEALVRWVRSLEADIVVLQEVGQGGRKALDELGRVLSHRYTPAGGMALLSRYPLSAPEQVRPQYEGGVRIRPDLVAATVHVAGHEPVRMVGVHFGWPQPAGVGQPIQFDWFARNYLAGVAPARLVIAGDFNSTPGSFGFRKLEALLPLARASVGLMTFPTPRGVFGIRPPRPFLAIDHVFVGADLRPLAVRRGPHLGSDHYPVVAWIGLDR